MDQALGRCLFFDYNDINAGQINQTQYGTEHRPLSHYIYHNPVSYDYLILDGTVEAYLLDMCDNQLLSKREYER